MNNVWTSSNEVLPAYTKDVEIGIQDPDYFYEYEDDVFSKKEACGVKEMETVYLTDFTLPVHPGKEVEVKSISWPKDMTLIHLSVVGFKNKNDHSVFITFDGGYNGLTLPPGERSFIANSYEVWRHIPAGRDAMYMKREEMAKCAVDLEIGGMVAVPATPIFMQGADKTDIVDNVIHMTKFRFERYLDAYGVTSHTMGVRFCDGIKRRSMPVSVDLMCRLMRM